MPAHRQRMALILHVPALQAHSTLRYAAWRDGVARFAAAGSDVPVDALQPQLVAHVALAAAVAAYEQWLRDEQAATWLTCCASASACSTRGSVGSEARRGGPSAAGAPRGPATVLGPHDERQPEAVRHRLVAQHLVRGTGREQPPVAQQRGVGGAHGQLLDVVADQDLGELRPGGGQVVQRVHEPLARRQVETGGRLVEQEQVRGAHERPRDQHAALLAVRQDPERPVGHLLRTQALQGRRRDREVGRRRGPAQRQGARPVQPGQHDVEGDRPTRRAVAPLHVTDARPELALKVDLPEARAEHVDGAAGRVRLGREQLQQRRLAAAVGSEQRPPLAALHLQVDAVQQPGVAADEVDTAQVEDGERHRTSLPAGASVRAMSDGSAGSAGDGTPDGTGTAGGGDGPTARPEAWRLADEMRRVIQRLVLVRAPEEELALAADAAAAFADHLEELRISEGLGEISEAGLAFGEFVHHSPVSGLANPVAPPLSMRVVDGVVHGEVVFGPAYEGPPGHVHGGLIAATYDEVLGRAQGRPGFTAYLTVQYRRPTPLMVPLLWRAWTDREDGRKRWVKATCHVQGEDGEVLLSEAEGLFLAPRTDHPLYQRLKR